MLIRLTIWTLAEAESSFQKAEIVIGDIVAQEAMGKENRVDIEYEIFTNLTRYGDILILIVVMACCNDIAGLTRDII